MSLVDEKNSVSLVQSISKSPVEPRKISTPLPQEAGLWAKMSPKPAPSGDDAQLLNKESDYTSVLRLIQKASDAIDNLQDRCRRLENDVLETNERLQAEATSSERVIKDWEQLATTLKAKLTTMEADLAAALQKVKSADERANAAETRAQASESRLQASYTRAHDAEARATAAEKRVAKEIELATSFRQKIIETFGSGSRLSALLDA